MVVTLFVLGLLSILGGVVTPFLLDPMFGSYRVIAWIPGCVSGIQFFALAILVDGVSEIRAQLADLMPVDEAQLMDQISPPPGWD